MRARYLRHATCDMRHAQILLMSTHAQTRGREPVRLSPGRRGAAPPVSQDTRGPESGLTRTSTASEVRRRGRAPAPGGHQTATCSEAKWPAKTRAGSSRQMLKAVPHASGDAPGSWSSEGRVAIRPRSRSAPTSIQAEGATHTSCRTEARDSCGSTSHDRLGPWRGRMP